MNIGAFAIVIALEQAGEDDALRNRAAGIADRWPLLAFTMSIFMFSLAGIPPLAGFIAKYKVFAAAIAMAGTGSSNTWLYWLVGVGLLTSVFALYYYANVIKQMYFHTEASPHSIRFSLPAFGVVLIGLVGVVLFGIYAEPILEFASELPVMAGVIPR